VSALLSVHSPSRSRSLGRPIFAEGRVGVHTALTPGIRAINNGCALHLHCHTRLGIFLVPLQLLLYTGVLQFSPANGGIHPNSPLTHSTLPLSTAHVSPHTICGGCVGTGMRAAAEANESRIFCLFVCQPTAVPVSVPFPVRSVYCSFHCTL